MNKKYIPGIIIVEGQHDVAKVSSLYDSIFVVTNGYEIPKEEIHFVKALNNDVEIIVLTDNDQAGEEIRNRLNKIRDNLINVVIKAPENSKKKGVAECDIKDIQNALDKYCSTKKEERYINLFELGLMGQDNSRQLRQYLCDTFHLGKCSTEGMIKRINLLDIDIKEIEGKLKDAPSK